MTQKTRAERNIEWIEKYCYSKPPSPRNPDGVRIKLLPHQRADMFKIYDNPHGRTRQAILSYGRKNGKTYFTACIVLLHLVGPEARHNAQLYSAARSLDQASVLFKLAAQIVRASPDIGDVVGIRDNKKELYCPDLGTLYKALSADAKTKYGLDPALLIHDELGQVEGPHDELYEALESATAAQPDPMSIIISTQAPRDADLLSVLIDAVIDVEGNRLEDADPATVVSLWTCPVVKDTSFYFTSEALRHANPAYGITQSEDELLRMAAQAKKMPTREASYRNLILNQRVEFRAPFVARAIWENNAIEDVGDPAAWSDVCVGLDLSAVGDLTALVLTGTLGEDKRKRIKAYFWLPAEGLDERSKKDKVPYNVWAKQGYITAVPGNTIDYDAVAPQVKQIFHDIKISKAGFDRWSWRHFENALKRAKMPSRQIDKFVSIAQGTASMSPVLRTLEADILAGLLVHDNNPVLNMCMANAVVSGPDESNRRLTKEKSRGRIDGAVALAICEASRIDAPVKKSARIFTT